MKLNDLFLLYFNTYKNTLSESTYKKDLSLYNKHIKSSFLGEINVMDLTFLDLQNYINSLLDNLKTDFYRLDDYVFTNPHTKTHYKDLRKAFLKILKNNNLEHIRIHDLRHLIASFSINYLNADINLVSNMLGYTNITTTTRYITINQKLTKNILENIFKRAKNEEQN